MRKLLCLKAWREGQHRGKTSAHARAQKNGEEFNCQIVNKNIAI
jgi:hypothetical protein